MKDLPQNLFILPSQPVALETLISVFTALPDECWPALTKVLNSESLETESRETLIAVHDYLTAIAYVMDPFDPDFNVKSLRVEAENFSIKIDGFLTTLDVGELLNGESESTDETH